ncbi:MAG: MATE family efflux transporter [Lachnospiraceae bacterium]|nr:MATE family efflux transporter [Lachnospiraceae bacterium]
MRAKYVTDMTSGSPMRHILRFAMPLLLGNLFQQLYNMVDSIVVGNYVGKDALAAVGTCGSLNFLFFSLSSGLAIGIGIIVAQYFGAKDDKNVRSTIANSFYVLASAALTVSLLGFLFTPALLKLLSTPEHVLGDAVLYMRTTCVGIIGIAFYNGVAAILRALGDSRTPLYFLMLSSIINVGLDLFFVLSLDMGVFGVALATIIAQAVSAITSLIYAYHKVSYFRLSKAELKPQPNIIVKSFRLGVPVALQNSMIAISCMVLQGFVNTFGETVMAAYTIINRIEQLVNQPYGSLGMALTTYAGQNMGAGSIERVKKGFRQSILVVLTFSLILLPIAYFFGPQIVGIFVKEQEVIDIAYRALRITSLFYFGLGMIYVPRALLNGCGDAAFSMINGVTEVACRILFAVIFTSIPFLGYWGIWMTTGATWSVTAVVCVLRYFQGKWKVKSITKRA